MDFVADLIGRGFAGAIRHLVSDKVVIPGGGGDRGMYRLRKALKYSTFSCDSVEDPAVAEKRLNESIRRIRETGSVPRSALQDDDLRRWNPCSTAG